MSNKTLVLLQNDSLTTIRSIRFSVLNRFISTKGRYPWFSIRPTFCLFRIQLSLTIINKTPSGCIDRQYSSPPPFPCSSSFIIRLRKRRLKLNTIVSSALVNPDYQSIFGRRCSQSDCGFMYFITVFVGRSQQVGVGLSIKWHSRNVLRRFASRCHYSDDKLRLTSLMMELNEY